MLNETTIYDVFEETITRMKGDGVLLLAGDPPNVMTIGWGTIGHIWRRQVFIVLVRPSRFTWGLMEKSTEFTVNILDDEFNGQISFCGTRSGRNVNKIEKCGFTLTPGIYTKTPFLAESLFHYECRIIHKNDLVPETLNGEIPERYYPSGDYHRVYYGEILGVFRNSSPL